MERDDLIEYSLDTHHNEEQGKAIRKKIYFVTMLLSVITIAEVALGVWWNSMGLPWELVKYTFIILTLVKAAYIIVVFMHLGDERKSFKQILLIPYLLFIAYLLFILLVEAWYVYDIRMQFNWLF